MENEKLSNKFVQKYDPIADTFVVVQSTNEEQKTKREPFSFFRLKQKTKAMESEIVQPIVQPNETKPTAPTNSATPTEELPTNRPIPSHNPSQKPQMPTPVIIAKNFYNRLVVLGLLYGEMARQYPDHKQVFDDLYGENLILQSTALLIYQSLSGNNYRPEQNKTTPTLAGNLCKDLIIVQSYLQETIELCLSLQRAVNVPNIDRQLIIINTTLLSQKGKLSSLQSNNCK